MASLETDLPTLRPDASLDVPVAGADSSATSTVTPTSAFFDYARYAADASTQGEEECKQQEEVEDGDCDRRLAQNEDQRRWQAHERR